MSLFPSINEVPADVSESHRRFLGAVKESVEVGQGLRGEPLERFVSVKMLLRAGIITAQQAETLARDRGG